MVPKYNEVGKITLSEMTDVTDPCYSKDVWCRATVNTVPGNYKCLIRRGTNGYCTECVIFHEDYFEKYKSLDAWELIAEIGVDSGLAGFFDEKQDYTSEQWSEFCNRIDTDEDGHSSKLYIWDGNSFFVAVEMDGGYDLYGLPSDKETEDGTTEAYFALRIHFGHEVYDER